jgi:hypothetical protein
MQEFVYYSKLLRCHHNVVRMSEESLPKVMYRWQPPTLWKRKPGRPRMRWLDNIKQALVELGIVKDNNDDKIDIDWDIAETIALGRDEWRQAINYIAETAQENDYNTFFGENAGKKKFTFHFSFLE